MPSSGSARPVRGQREAIPREAIEAARNVCSDDGFSELIIEEAYPFIARAVAADIARALTEDEDLEISLAQLEDVAAWIEDRYAATPGKIEGDK